MKKLICPILFSLVVGSPLTMAEVHMGYSADVPIRNENISCYSDSILLGWTGIDGIWKPKGEPGPYHGLWERKWGIEGERSCEKIPKLLDLASANGGSVPASLTVTRRTAHLCKPSYDPEPTCSDRVIEEAQLKLPYGVTLHHMEVLP
jgi:hypothetical protein